MAELDPFDPRGPQAEAARALRVERPLGPHTYMYRPSRFKPGRAAVSGGAAAYGAAWEDASARFATVVTACWNGYVQTIRAGRYADLHLLKDALESHLVPRWRAFMQYELLVTRSNAAHIELDRVERLVLEPGPQNTRRTERMSGDPDRPPTLRDALVPGATDVSDNETFHGFARAGWGSSHKTSDVFEMTSDTTDEEYERWKTRYNRPDRFYLAPPYSGAHVGTRRLAEMEQNGMKANEIWTAGQDFDFAPDDSFADAHAAVSVQGTYLKAVRDEHRDIVETINLRRSILETVLYEHEVYGHAPLWSEMGDRAEQLLRDEGQESRQREATRHLNDLQANLSPPPRRGPSGYSHRRTNGPVIAAMKRAADQLHGWSGAASVAEVTRRYGESTGTTIDRDTVYSIARDCEPIVLSD